MKVSSGAFIVGAGLERRTSLAEGSADELVVNNYIHFSILYK
jgi:hypothetical protein